MRLRQLVVLGVVLGGAAPVADASVQLVDEQPTDGQLAFDQAPFGGQSAPQTVRVMNVGSPAGDDFSFVSGPFMIIATSGGLATGQEKSWQIVCAPTEPDPSENTGTFNIDVCGTSCGDDEWTETIFLSCQPGLLATPDPILSLPTVFAYQLSQQVIPFTNSGTSAITITSLASNAAAFSGAPATATLPVTLAPGDSLDVLASFDTSAAGASDGLFGFLDVVAGTTIAGRVQVFGQTFSQLAPNGWNFGVVPPGAVYTLPISVRNSFPGARTITAVTADLADYTVTGLAGTTLAPGQRASGLLTFTAAALGSRVASVSVAFDTGQGDTARVAAQVAGTFSVATGDTTPTDGRLDFGIREAGAAAVEQTVTLTNLGAADLSVPGCDAADGQFALVTACPTTIPAGGSVALTVRFTPMTAGDALSGIGIGLGGVGAVFVALTARVVTTQLAVSVSSLAFPDTLRADSVQQVVTISNVATDPITVPVAVTGAGFTIDQTMVTIAGAASAQVTVAFQPPAAGVFSGALEVGAVGDPDHAIVPLSGVGLSPQLSVATTLDLGSVAIGSTGEAMLTLQNLDRVNSVTIDQLVVDGAGFAAELPDDPVLAPGAMVTVVVRFTSTVAGPAAGTLSVVLAGDPTPFAIVSLTAEGEAPTPPPATRHGGGCDAGGAGGTGAGCIIAALAVALRRRRRPSDRNQRSDRD